MTKKGQMNIECMKNAAKDIISEANKILELLEQPDFDNIWDVEKKFDSIRGLAHISNEKAQSTYDELEE